MNGIILFISGVRYVIDETICLPFGLVGVIAGEVGAYGRRIAMRFKRRRDEIIASERAGHASFVGTSTRSPDRNLTFSHLSALFEYSITITRNAAAEHVDAVVQANAQ